MHCTRMPDGWFNPLGMYNQNYEVDVEAPDATNIDLFRDACGNDHYGGVTRVGPGAPIPPPSQTDIAGHRPFTSPPTTQFSDTFCEVQVRCFTVTIPGLGISTPGSHCGLIIRTQGGGTWSIDGTGGNENNFDWVTPPFDPVGNRGTGPFVKMPGSTCECLRRESASWNRLQIPRQTDGMNSNWSLGCLVKRCNFQINWGGFGEPFRYTPACGCGWDHKPIRCKCPEG